MTLKRLTRDPIHITEYYNGWLWVLLEGRRLAN